MRIDIVTIFPKMLESTLNESILKRAKAKGAVDIHIHDLRTFTHDKHRSVDDRPYGGGPGMVMRVEPIWEAVEYIKSKRPAIAGTPNQKSKIILLTPQGKRFDQKLAKKISRYKHLILICGHYEGVDERVKAFVTDEISIGDYVLTGGELPALVVIDAVVRLLPGVLGDSRSASLDTFNNGLLKYPQYTRPRSFKGMDVPDILFSGNHQKIELWRKAQAIKRTRVRRPDLLKNRRKLYGQDCIN